MDFNRQNVQQNAGIAQPPAHSNHAEPLVPNRGHGRKHSLKSSGDRNPVGWGLLLIALVLIAFGLLWFFHVNGDDEIGQVNSKEYQAIFLSNGQVYFGKLDTLNSSYAKITDIFYLQVKQTVQPKQSDNSNQNQNVSLVKLGNELHGPEDAMMINRSQILFWENLKPSGKVTQAINQYNKNGGAASQSGSLNNGASQGTTPTSTSSSTGGSSDTTSGTSNNSTSSSSNSTPTGGSSPTSTASKRP